MINWSKLFKGPELDLGYRLAQFNPLPSLKRKPFIGQAALTGSSAKAETNNMDLCFRFRSLTLKGLIFRIDRAPC
jgi:hypothetical protein